MPYTQDGDLGPGRVPRIRDADERRSHMKAETTMVQAPILASSWDAIARLCVEERGPSLIDYQPDAQYLRVGDSELGRNQTDARCSRSPESYRDISWVFRGWLKVAELGATRRCGRLQCAESERHES